MRFIIIGFGYWGKNFIKLFNTMAGIRLVGIVDINDKKLDIPFYKSLDDLIADNVEFDAAIVATPTSTHFEYVSLLLGLGKHVFCEKPLTTNLKSTKVLEKTAKDKGLVLHTNFIYLYNNAIEEIYKLKSKNHLGELKSISFERTGLGPIRTDVNALWDLSSHDISILSLFTEEDPYQIISTGRKDKNSTMEEIVNVSLFYKSGLFVTLYSSWLHPQKKRIIKIIGNKKMIVFDDVALEEKVKIYNQSVDNIELKNLELNQSIINLSAGEITIPELNMKEPLRNSFDDFISKITNKNYISYIDNSKISIKTTELLEKINDRIVS